MNRLIGILTTWICAGLLGHTAAQCLNGYIDPGDSDLPSCYKLGGKDWPIDAIGWDNARDRCRNEGGDLAVITSPKELEFLRSKIVPTDYNPIVAWHVGLRRTDGVIWTWVDGSPVDKTYIHIDYIAAVPQNNGAMTKAGNFTAVFPYSADFYICERSKYTYVQCDGTQGWKSASDGTCIKYHDSTRQTFWTARGVCQQDNADLVSIAGSDVNLMVAGFTSQSWIGLTTALNNELTADNKSALWKWSNGNKLTYENWDTSANRTVALNNRNNTCAYMRGGLWINTACSTQTSVLKFSCQRKAGECPDGWTRSGDFCYMFGYRKSWLEANHDCNSRGANLVVYNTNSVKDFVTSTLPGFAANDQNFVWVGYKQDDSAGAFKPVVEVQGAQTNWASGWPKTGQLPYGCARVSTSSTDGKWTSSTCADLNGYLCQVPAGRSVKPPTAYLPNPLLYCEYGWFQWDQECYLVLKEESNFEKGRQLCGTYSSSLALIDDIDYQAFVTKLTSSSDRPAYWIGLRKAAGSYVWVKGDKPADKFQNFDDYADHDQPNRDCVYMYGGQRENAGRWDLLNCDQALPIICSKDPSLATTVATPPATFSGTPSTRCPSGWEEDGVSDYCYSFMRHTSTWVNALHACRSLGGELAYIHTFEQMRFVAARIKERGSFWWLGLNIIGSEAGYYAWSTSKEPIAFTYWASGEPTHSNGDCVAAIASNGMWQFKDCMGDYNFICQRVADIARPTRPPMIITTPVGGSLVCNDSSWTQYSAANDYCYKVFKMKATWDEALAYCKNLVDFGSLTSIANVYEQDLVTLLVNQKNTESGNVNRVWIGMYDNLDASYPRMVQYQWSDGTKITFSNWEPKQPSSTDKQCVALQASAAGQWHDTDCATSAFDGFVCKAPPKAISGPKTTIQPSGCSPPYTQAYEGKCYFIYPQGFTSWQSAKTACSGYGGQLLVLANRQEQNYIAVALSGSGVPVSPYWMGLSGTNNNWLWVDGTTPTFTNWDANYNAPQTMTCVAITDSSSSAAGLWTLKDCGTSLPYICEKTRVGWTRASSTARTSVNPLYCPTGWITRGSRCYLPIKEKFTWSDALKHCETNYYSLLASFLSLDDQNVVARQFSSFGVKNAWIGLSRRDSERGWQWMDGTPVLFENWASGEPDNADLTKTCSYMYYSSRNDSIWVSQSCSSAEQQAVCMRYTGSAVSTTKRPSEGNATLLCNGTGWEIYNNYCYYPELTYQTTWGLALEACTKMDGNLVSILSPEEDFFVASLVGHPQLPFVWIGLSEFSYTGFYWSDGSPYTHTNWDSGAHDINGPCVAMRVGTGKWLNQHCESPFSFVCKKPVGGAAARPTTPPPQLNGRCPGDFLTYPKSSSCFRIVNSPLATQTEAVTQCQAVYGRKANLASFRDVVDMNFVISKLRNTTFPTQTAYIGLYDYSKIMGQPSFRWLDNSPLYFTNWDANEPDVLSTTPPGTCVDMFLSGAAASNWRAQKNCNLKQAYICSLPKSPDYPQTDTPPSPCPPQWVSYNEHCYFVDGRAPSTALSWSAANEACLKLDSALVSIHDPYEQAAVTHAVMTSDPFSPPLNFWIGLNTNNAPDVWSWSDGWPVDYTSWLPTEPLESSSKRCAAGVVRGLYASEAGGWASIDCRNKSAFVCRKTTGKPNNDDANYIEGSCPPGWLNGISKCYYVNATARFAWAELIVQCRKHNGTFSALDTLSDNQLVATELLRQKNLYGFEAEDVWLAYASYGGVLTTPDNSVVSFTNWADGVGPSLNDESVFMKQSSYWYLASPEARLGYVCKQPKLPKPTYPPIDWTLSTDQIPDFTKGPPVYSYEDTFDSGVGMIVGVCLAFVVLLAGLTVLLFYLKRKNAVPAKIDDFITKTSGGSGGASSSYPVSSKDTSGSGAASGTGLVGFENVTFEPAKDASTVPKATTSEEGNEYATV